MPWVFWVLFLIGGLMLQKMLGPGIGSFVTQSILVSSVSLVYGFILVSTLLKGCTRSTASDAHETTTGNYGAERLAIILEQENINEDSDHRNFSDTTQASENLESEVLDIDLIQDEPVQETSERRRLYFLDNVKSFLTLLVVSHHVTCSFGGCGPESWFLIVGLHDNSFQPFAKTFVTMNQGFFMSLFFFISAYFVPSSYKRHGKKSFLLEKAKRLWIPALFVTIVMFPLVILYCLWFVGKDLAFVKPLPGHTWFLFWLLILNLVYVSIHEKSNVGEPKEWEFPGVFKRYLFYGPVVCGLGMTIVLALLEGGGQFFASMPLSIGSLINDLLFFMAGIVAKGNDWLEGDYLSTKIGMTGFALAIMVVIESTAMVYLLLNANSAPIYGLFGLIVAGIYCIDMSLAVLRFFQTYLDFESKRSKFFSDAAYTVYLIHPCIILSISSLWIKIYESQGYVIEWKELYSETPIEGGGLTLVLSWLCCNLLAHLIVWPLAWYLRKLPGLRQIL